MYGARARSTPKSSTHTSKYNFKVINPLETRLLRLYWLFSTSYIPVVSATYQGQTGIVTIRTIMLLLCVYLVGARAFSSTTRGGVYEESVVYVCVCSDSSSCILCGNR